MNIEPEYIAVIACGLIGYGAVSWFLGSKKEASTDFSGGQFKGSSQRSEDSQDWQKSKEERRSDSNEQFHGSSNNNYGDYSRREERKKEERRSGSLEWFEVLEVKRTASLPEIKAAYRKKISGYHPDKVAMLADELRILAEKRSKEINDAYDTAVSLHRK